MAVVEVATRGTTIAVQHGLIRIGAAMFHPGDLDMVIAQVPAVTITGDAMLLFSVHGVELVICDRRRQPAASLWPIGAGASLAAGTIRAQAALAPRRRATLWRQIVRAKIREQARHVSELGGKPARLERLAVEVADADPANVEAQAARVYWPAVFGSDFRRNAGGPTNDLLDFGYAVLRAILARQLHAAGLHRSLGIHHHSAENEGNLADDLIEPLRPAVDRAVRALHAVRDRHDRTETDSRSRLAAIGEWPVRTGGEWQKLRNAAGALARSFRDIVDGGAARLALPMALGSAGDARRLANDVGDGDV